MGLVVAEAGAEAEVEAPEWGAEGTMAQYLVKEEGLGKPPKALGLTLRR